MTAPLSATSTGFFMPILNHPPIDDMRICSLAKSKKQLLKHISTCAGILTKIPLQAVF
tara:strand:+ start:204 stop:377 length:174 start_codon:yes stop_codon:yes gene_type:complete